MPRRLRIELPGGLYHVTNRGVDKRDIVIDDHDRTEWFRLFARVALRCRWRVFAHVLMTNHFHIFLRLSQANLSTGMHDCESGYAALFNARHGRSGTLFEGRFRAVMVESEGHGWVLSRYLHLNPCRAKMVERPEDYRWSTYRHYLDPTAAPSWLDWRTILSEMGGTESAARIAYRRFVNDGLRVILSNPLDDAVEGMLYGGPKFVEANSHLLDPEWRPVSPAVRVPTSEEVIASVASSFQIDAGALKSSGKHANVAREVAIWLCREAIPGATQPIADAFGGVRRSTISETVRRCRKRQESDVEFRERCEALRRLLEE